MGDHRAHGRSDGVRHIVIAIVIADAVADRCRAERSPAHLRAHRLRSRDGGVVDLTGVWAGSSSIAGSEETAQLLQMGDCVYASVRGENSIFSIDGIETRAEIVTILVGHLRPDFAVDFEVLVVSQPVWNGIAEYSPMVMLVEWDDTTGQIRLREDRAPGTPAQRCLDENPGFCEVPVIWYRIAEAPPP